MVLIVRCAYVTLDSISGILPNTRVSEVYKGDKEEITVGSSAENDIVLTVQKTGVSGKHGKFFVRAGKVYYQDFSRNGTTQVQWNKSLPVVKEHLKSKVIRVEIGDWLILGPPQRGALILIAFLG